MGQIKNIKLLIVTDIKTTMKLYKDVFTGKEVFTDAYKIEKVDDIYYKVWGQWRTVDNSIDDSLIGGNKSAEAEEEDEDEVKAKEANVVAGNKLEEVDIDTEKQFKSKIKDYVKKVVNKVKETDPARADFLVANLPDKFVKPMLKEFKDKKLRFFAVEEDCYDIDGPLIHFSQEVDDGLEQDGTKCWIMVLSDCLEEENC